MSRVLWKGAIVFGLVNIPVSLYSGTRSGTFDFDYLDKRDMAPVGYQRINKRTGKPVDWDDIVKGYQYEKGEYVVLGDEDFRLANPKATQSVEILHFVDGGAIAPEFFDTPYRLAPDKRGEKGYALLRETLKKTSKIGIAQVVIRTRQHLAALRPDGDALRLDTLRYADELLDAGEFELPKASSVKVTAKEQEMAQRLVEDMSAEWNPEEYHDTYREDLMARIKEKVKAGETEEIPEAPKRTGGGAQVIDLMAALQKSLAQRTGRDSGAKAERAPAKKRAAHAGHKASRTTATARRKRA
jgi:DNA end-binding protein Ku